MGTEELAVKGKIRNDSAVINLFKAEPPVQDAHGSLGSFAYRALRDAIRAGRIPPGPHIRELEVAQWLKISRASVAIAETQNMKFPPFSNPAMFAREGESNAQART